MPPVGWLGSGLAQTLWTPELLAAAGIRYLSDWVYDDEPTTIHTANGELMALPDTLELNDIAMMIVQHHESGYLLQRAIDQFDRLYQEGKERAKIMALAVSDSSAVEAISACDVTCPAHPRFAASPPAPARTNSTPRYTSPRRPHGNPSWSNPKS